MNYMRKKKPDPHGVRWSRAQGTRWVGGAHACDQLEILVRREHAHRAWNAAAGLALAMVAACLATRTIAGAGVHRSLGPLEPWETLTPTGITVSTI